MLPTKLEAAGTGGAQLKPERSFGVCTKCANLFCRAARSRGQWRLDEHHQQRTLTLSRRERVSRQRQNVPASLKIGRYSAITMPPTNTPMITMIRGSSSVDSVSTALLTSSS